ncbi:hypothetical protein MRB53_036881 [Persea americana]|nr:hypothetical protein MRB53_036881 [Persea americana]
MCALSLALRISTSSSCTPVGITRNTNTVISDIDGQNLVTSLYVQKVLAADLFREARQSDLSRSDLSSIDDAFINAIRVHGVLFRLA